MLGPGSALVLTLTCMLLLCSALLYKAAADLNKPCIRPVHAVQLGAGIQQTGKALRMAQAQMRLLSHQTVPSQAQAAPQTQASSRPQARAPLQRAGSRLCREEVQPAVALGWQA